MFLLSVLGRAKGGGGGTSPTLRTGSITSQLKVLRGVASGFFTPSGTQAGTAAYSFNELTASAAGRVTATGTAAGSFKKVTASVVAVVNETTISGQPYPKVPNFQQVTSFTGITRFAQESDLFPSTERTDGRLLMIGCDGNGWTGTNPVKAWGEEYNVSGTPPNLTATGLWRIPVGGPINTGPLGQLAVDISGGPVVAPGAGPVPASSDYAQLTYTGINRYLVGGAQHQMTELAGGTILDMASNLGSDSLAIYGITGTYPAGLAASKRWSVGTSDPHRACGIIALPGDDVVMYTVAGSGGTNTWAGISLDGGFTFETSTNQNEVITTVKPPDRAPRFLSLPFTDSRVKLGVAWYYPLSNNVPAVIGCDHPAGLDINGYENHCGFDYYTDAPLDNFQLIAPASGEARWFTGNGSYNEVQFVHDAQTAGGQNIWSRLLHCADTVGSTFPHISTSWQTVTKGQNVAWAGNTGTTGIHLHWGVGIGGLPRLGVNGGTYVDPYDIADDCLRRGVPPLRNEYPQPPTYSPAPGSSNPTLGTNHMMSFGTAPALPPLFDTVFTEGAGEDAMICGVMQLGAGYGSGPASVDRDYIYVFINDKRQLQVYLTNGTAAGGAIYCARVKISGTGGNINNTLSRAQYSFYDGLDGGGNPIWTANGALKTTGTPIFNDANGSGFYFNMSWVPALSQFVACWTPVPGDILAVAHAPTPWDPAAWRMMSYGSVTTLRAGEQGFYLGGRAVARWSTTSRLAVAMSTYDDLNAHTAATQPGDDLAITSANVTAPTGGGTVSNVLLWYEDSQEDPAERRYTYFGRSTDAGANFTLYSADRVWNRLNPTSSLQLQPIGVLQLGPGYSMSTQTVVDNDYAYLILNNRGFFFSADMWTSGSRGIAGLGGTLYMARVKIRGGTDTPDRARFIANYQYFNGISGGNPTWTGTAPGVAIASLPKGVGRHVSLQWIPALNKFAMAFTYEVNKVGVIVSDTPWTASGWRVLAWDAPVGVTANEQLFNCFLPQRWQTSSRIWAHLSPYPIGTVTGVGDNLALVRADLVPITDPGTGTGGDFLRTWSTSALPMTATSGGSVVGDGDEVARWINDAGNYSLTQVTAGERPTHVASDFPGLKGLRFTEDRRLTGAVDNDVLMVSVNVGGLITSKTVVSRDTSEATTKPAFELIIEETF